MESVTLSSAVRRNLLTMQGTADMMSKTQTRLATGKRVNSALDNPTNFFTASALNSRSSDLMRLQDAVGNAVQTIEAADNGIKAITKLVESAQGTARQALQSTAPEGAGASSTGSDIIVNADGAGSADPNNDPASVGAGVINFNIGGSDYLLTLNGTETLEEIATAMTDLSSIEMNSLTASDFGSPAKFNVDIDNTSGSTITVTSVSGTAFADLGLAGSVANSITDEGTFVDTSSAGTANTNITGLTGTSTIGFSVDGNTSTLNLDGSESMTEIADLISGIAGLTGSVEAGATDGTFKLKITADAGVTTFSATGATATTLGINGTEDVAAGITPSTTRTNLETEYNALLKQIDQLTTDAGFNGNNLLDGDDLKVIFNETGSSSLSVKGVDLSSSGLSLSAISSGGFQSNTSIESTLKSLDSAVDTLRSNASTFGSNLSTVQARKDFTSNMINTLETGAANLTLADINKEGANMLALQTRQQLSTTALSMASQQDQAVLRLF